MNQPDNSRIQKLFLAALELPVDQRDAWLVEQCGDDADLLSEVRALLEHDSPDDDPLEKGLDEALEDIPTTLILDSSTGGEPSEGEMTQMDGDLFLSKLSEVGVLSPEEIEALNQTIASGQSSANPRQIASHLVSQGKLTDYQASALLKGQPELLIDKYLILDLIDAGGMGMVFKAIHRPMNRTVAIKMIAQHLLASPEQVKRFQREVRVAATLEHPNIVRSYDADRARGVHFLVMEYVRGDNLATIVRRQGPMPVEQAVDCIRQAAKGLRYAQKQGVIHRDIKPGNLMLGDEGLVKVLDLGLANVDASFRLAQQSSLTGDQDRPTAQSMAGSELTSAGAVLGTVSFMAPEQSLDARKADTRADIYSLGCTLYFLLMGESPYSGDTIFQVFMEHRERSIPTLRDKRPDVPEKVEAVCQKMLAKAPEDRYQSMGELLAGIEDCDITPPPEKAARSVSEGRAKSPVSPTFTLAAQPSTTVQSKSLASLVWLSALVLLLAFGGGYWWWQSNAVQGNAQYDASSADNGNVTAAMQPAAIAEPQCGLRFDGEGDFVEIPLIDHLGDDPLTIEAWVHLEANESAGIVFQGSFGRYSLYHTPADAKLKPHHWIFGHEFNSGCLNAISHEKVEFGRRYHIAAVWRNHRPRLYIDGVLASADRGGYWTSRPSIRNAYIGGWPQTEDFVRSAFHGLIDELRISDVARYSEDFTPQDRFETDDDTLALYHFDEGEGDVLHDASGNNHHGKIVGARWVRLDEGSRLAEQNRALSFDSGKVTLPVFDWKNTESVTWEATATLDEDKWSHIFLQYENNWGLELTRDHAGQVQNAVKWSATAKRSKDGGQFRAELRESVMIGREYQLAMVVSHDEIILFVDGVELGRELLPPDFELPETAISLGDVFKDRELHGTIDEIRFSNIARYTEDYTPVDRFEPDEHTIALYHCDEEGNTLIDSSGSGYHVNLTEATTGNVSRVKVYDEVDLLRDFDIARDIQIHRGRANAWEFTRNGVGVQANKLSSEYAAIDVKFPRPVYTNYEFAGEFTSLLGIFTINVPVGQKTVNVVVRAKTNNGPWISGLEYVDNKLLPAHTAPAFSDGVRHRLTVSVAHEAGNVAIVASFDGQEFVAYNGDASRLSGNSWMGTDFKIHTSGSITLHSATVRPLSGDAIREPNQSIDDETRMSPTGVTVYNEANMSAADLLATGEYEWGPAERLPEPINSDANEFSAHMTADGLTMVLSSARESTYGRSDFWISTRNTTDSDWSEPTNLGENINSENHEREAIIFEDLKTIYFSREGDLSFTSRRTSLDAEWSTPEPFEVDGQGVYWFDITSDGRTMVFPKGMGNGNHDLFIGRRATQDEPWTEVASMGVPINTDDLESGCTISDDGCLLIFDRKVGGGEWWMATRSGWEEPWTLPVRLDCFDGEGTPLSPRLSPDGKSLLFLMDHKETSSQLDIYTSKLVRKPSTEFDEANMSAADLLATGEYEWRVIEKLPEPINSAAGELGAHMTADGLTIVFASQRGEGGFGAHDLWMCTRSSPDGQWSDPVNLGDQINSDKHETAPVLSPNGLTLYFERVGDGSFVSTRNSLESPWSQATSFEPGNAGTPWTTSDGLAMVYSAWDQDQLRDLRIKRRTSPFGSWTNGFRLEPPISSQLWEESPTLSDDGRLLIFHRRTEANDARVGNLWMATRANWDAPWSEPVSIDSLNSGTLDRTPRLLADGKSFLFDSWRDREQGDIYLARLVRKNAPKNAPIPESLDAYDDGTWISILPVEGQLDYWGIWQPSEDRTQLVDGEFHAEDAGGIYDGLQFGGLRVNDAVIRSKATKDGSILELRLRNSHQNGWYAAKWQNTNLFQIRKQVRDAPEDPWKQMVLASRTTSETYGETLELAFSAIGSQLALYVNGQLVLSANDSELPSGAAGFQVNNAKATFKELKIQILDEPQPSIAPFMDAGQWAEAIALGEKKISHKPSDAYRWLQVAPAYVLGGDEDAYREFCRRMLKQFEGNTDEVVMERMIHAGLLLPGIIEAKKYPGDGLIKALSETKSTTGSNPWSEASCAIFAYRAGDLEQAIEFARKSNSHSPKKPVIVMNESILAMAFHRQEKADESRQALESAAKALADCQKHYDTLGIRNPHPHDYWMPSIFYHEAKAVVDKPFSPPKEPDDAAP